MVTKVLGQSQGRQRLRSAYGEAVERGRRGTTAARPLRRPARLSARQSSPRGGSKVRIADVVVDEARQQATRGGRLLALTPQDLTLLALLVRHAGSVMSRQRIARAIWGRDYSGKTNFVEVGMWRLRSKLDAQHKVKLIHAVRGVGYICAVRDAKPGRRRKLSPARGRRS